LVGGLYSQMLNERLNELAQQADPPFLGASGGAGRWVRSTEAFSLGVSVPDTGVRRGFTAALTEVERVERHGFLPSELARAKRGVAIPSGDSLLALRQQVASADVGSYKETVSDAPLVAADLKDAAITAEQRDTALGITTWTLANGVRVILKPTDFKADQVLFT